MAPFVYLPHVAFIREWGLLDFDASFSVDLSRLEEAVFHFDLSDGDEQTVDLQKKFMHLWLQILDQEIMEL